MVVERDRKKQRHHEKYREPRLMKRTDHTQNYEVSKQNHQLSCNHVNQDCPYEKPFLAFEADETRTAPILNVEWLFHD
jgi:hypothetical protein